MKQQALDHYDRMIAWAETQKPLKKVSIEDMLDDIEQYWESGDCIYCNNRNCEAGGCELYKDGNYIVNCCGGLWLKMDKSKTWKTWLKYARQVREYIEVNG